MIAIMGVVATRTYDGSYIWYVNSGGSVRSLYRFDPRVTGYVDGVFPKEENARRR